MVIREHMAAFQQNTALGHGMARHLPYPGAYHRLPRCILPRRLVANERRLVADPRSRNPNIQASPWLSQTESSVSSPPNKTGHSPTLPWCQTDNTTQGIAPGNMPFFHSAAAGFVLHHSQPPCNAELHAWDMCPGLLESLTLGWILTCRW
jgi:hypothetical protein